MYKHNSRSSKQAVTQLEDSLDTGKKKNVI